MQLEGVLSRFTLRELLELSVASLVNGALEVYAPSGVHRLFFVQGECVHATSPDTSGFDALWPLFELSDAPFKFVAGSTTREHTITEPTLQIVEQAATLARQWSAIRPYVPTLDIVPQLVAHAGGEHVRIYEEDWPTLSCVDGTRTIREIAQMAVADTVEICTSLLRLKERGLVTLEQRRAEIHERPPQVEAPQPRVLAKDTGPLPKPNSFFAKLLTTLPEASLAATPHGDAPRLPEPAAPASGAAPLPPQPLEYDDILSLLRAG